MEKKCKRGHSYPVNARQCPICRSENNRRWRAENPDYQNKWYAKNTERAKAYSRKAYQKNKAYSREYHRAWVAKHPERAHELRRRWLAENPDYYRDRYWENAEENREYSRLQARKWRASNPEQAKAIQDAFVQSNPEYFSEYAAANKDEARERKRRWRHENPDKARDMDHRRRARMKGGMAERISASDWVDICAQFLDSDGRTVCAYCNKLCARPTVDHLVPLARGGRHEICNVLPACVSCNCSKTDKLIFEWPKAKRLLAPSFLAELTERTRANGFHELANPRRRCTRDAEARRARADANGGA